MTVTDAVLARLDRGAFGSGAAPSENAGDDRAGRYWKVTDDRVSLAVKIALITGRPLLLEGLSGTGKSSLARALAETLGWTYYEAVVNSRTEVEHLAGSVDHVHRLHEAELAAKAGRDFVGEPERFLRPGVLWWAFDPVSAVSAGQGAMSDPGQRARDSVRDTGAVVLIDEIDKADPDLPNNLLVPFGSKQLDIEARSQPVTAQRDVLLCVTSNRERDMPPAFLRRCVTLELEYPAPEQLVEIARQHVLGDGVAAMAETVRRRFVPDNGASMSAAEFVDAVRAAVGLGLPADGSGEAWDRLQELFEATHQRRRW